MTCPCGSSLALTECCGPIIAGSPAPSAEAMMRARYTAYTQHNIDFIMASTHPDRKGLVEFKAHYLIGGVKHHHHEVSGFVNSDAGWQFRDGEVLHAGPSEKLKPVVNELKIGRNDPCHCGSGKKFKKCHGA